MHRTNIGLALALGVLALVVARPSPHVSAQTTARGVPTFEVDRAWPRVPAKWKIGEASSFAVDAKDNVWLLHRPRTLKAEDAAMAAPPVIVFDAQGNFVKAWGGAGTGYEWPQREHGIHLDARGSVWVSGINCPTNGIAYLKPVNDDQLLKFTQDGKFLLQIGRSNQSKGNADTQNVHRAADMAVYAKTNELFVADGYGNDRVIVFDAESGKFKRVWGAFGNKPVDDDSCSVVAPKAFSEGQGAPGFNVVHAIRVSRDGVVYVADRENRRVQQFTPDGTFVRQLVKNDTPFARNLTLSSDPEQQFLYVGNGQEIAVVDRKALAVVGTIKVPGQIGGGHHIATDSKGNLYIAQTGAGFQKLAIK